MLYEVITIILLKNQDIISKDREIRTNEILIKKAELEAKKQEIEALKKSIYVLEQKLINKQNTEKALKLSLENERERLTNLQVDLGRDGMTQLIKETKHKIEMLQKDKENVELAVKKLKDMQKKVIDALSVRITSYNVCYTKLLRCAGQACCGQHPLAGRRRFVADRRRVRFCGPLQC